MKLSADDSQRICKSWMLKPQAKMATSIITAHSYVNIGNYGLQSLYSLKPTNWLDLNQTPDLEPQYRDAFRAIRQDFLVKRLKKIFGSNIDVASLANQLRQSKTVKGCTDLSCRGVNEQSFRVCYGCRSSELGDVLFDIDETETSTDAEDGFESKPYTLEGF